MNGVGIVPEKWTQRKSDISFYDSIRELTDNSVDAKATKISVIFVDGALIVCDNGEKSMGINELNTCFIEGRSTKGTLDIGSFGVGLKQTAVQFNSDGSGSATCHILSGTLVDGKPSYGYINVCPKTVNEQIERDGVSGWQIAPASDLRQTLPSASLELCKSAYSQHICKDDEFHTGTVIYFSECDVPELKSENLTDTVEKLRVHLGERYYEKLSKNSLQVSIYAVFNNSKFEPTQVRPYDWLMRNQIGTKIYDFEHTVEGKSSSLKFVVAVTHQNNHLVRVLKGNPYQSINAENSGISLCFQDVMVAFATKSQEVTPEIKEAYKALYGKYPLRDKIFFNSGDNYSSQIRVMIYADKEWSDMVYMDETKNQFAFSDKLAPALAQLMTIMDDAKKYSTTMKEKPNASPIPTVKVPTNVIVTPAPDDTEDRPKTQCISKISMDDILEISLNVLSKYPEENRSLLYQFTSEVNNEIKQKLSL